jgi:hypothetical protein
VIRRKQSLSGQVLIEQWLSEGASHSGLLKKLSSKGLWNRRYCEIRGPLIVYWKSQKASRLPPPPRKSQDGRGSTVFGRGKSQEPSGDQASLEATTPDAAIDLRLVLNVKINKFDVVLEVMPQVSSNRHPNAPSFHTHVHIADALAPLSLYFNLTS